MIISRHNWIVQEKHFFFLIKYFTLLLSLHWNEKGHVNKRPSLLDTANHLAYAYWPWQPFWTFLGLEYINLCLVLKQGCFMVTCCKCFNFLNVSTHTIGNIMREPTRTWQELFMKYRKFNEFGLLSVSICKNDGRRNRVVWPIGWIPQRPN